LQKKRQNEVFFCGVWELILPCLFIEGKKDKRGFFLVRGTRRTKGDIKKRREGRGKRKKLTLPGLFLLDAWHIGKCRNYYSAYIQMFEKLVIWGLLLYYQN